MSNHFVLPGQKAWPALPNKCCRPAVPRPLFVFENRPSSQTETLTECPPDSQGTASHQRWEIHAETLRSDTFTEFSSVYIRTGTYCAWRHDLTIVSPGTMQKLGPSKTINCSPHSPLIYFFHQAYKMFLCGCACLHALFLLRIQQMEA